MRRIVLVCTKCTQVRRYIVHTYLYRAVHANENVYVHIYTKVYAIMYCTLIKLNVFVLIMYM